jgi:hypothetical protein
MRSGAGHRAELPVVRQGWRLLALVGAGVLVVSAMLLSTHASDRVIFSCGLVAGLLVGVAGALMVQTVGSGSRRMDEAGRQSSSQQLRRAAPAGWFSFDHISFDSATECDHLVLGSGGAYALQTRWCADWSTRSGRRLLARAARAARDEARKAKNAIAGPVARPVVDVAPVIVAWGHGPVPKAVDEVPVVRGEALAEWLSERAIPRYEDAEVAHAYAAVTESSGRVRVAIGGDPLGEIVAWGLRGLVSCAATALAAGLAAFAGVMLLAVSMRIGPAVVVVAAAAGAGALRVRNRTVHFAGLGWLTGAATGAVVVAALVVATNLPG